MNLHGPAVKRAQERHERERLRVPIPMVPWAELSESQRHAAVQWEASDDPSVVRLRNVLDQLTAQDFGPAYSNPEKGAIRRGN